MKILIENESFECASGATVYDALKEAGKISKEVLAATVCQKTVALSTVLKEGDAVSPLTFADEEGRKVYRHTILIRKSPSDRNNCVPLRRK